MSDIYKQKARKYKYKYLKLKQELEGGGGIFVKKTTRTLPGYTDYDGDYVPPRETTIVVRTTNPIHCTRSPHLNDDDLEKLKIIPQYPDTKTNIRDFNNFESIYDRRLLKYKDYKNELNNYIKIKNIDKIDKTYIREIVYAGKIEIIFNKEKRKILEDKYDMCKISYRNHGYIISKNIKENYNINSYSIIKLEYLKIAILKFIIPLHNAGFVLNNIEWKNIMIDPRSNQIIFDSSKITESKYTKIDIIALYELGYHFIERKNIDIINPNKYKDIDHLIEILNKIINYPQRIEF
jgi:hypothetical protein